jgi:hypothetical protein
MQHSTHVPSKRSQRSFFIALIFSANSESLPEMGKKASEGMHDAVRVDGRRGGKNPVIFRTSSSSTLQNNALAQPGEEADNA